VKFLKKISLLSGAATRQRRPRLDGRIVGGEDVDIADFPYQVTHPDERILQAVNAACAYRNNYFEEN
jgi:hypothetical protein